MESRLGKCAGGVMADTAREARELAGKLIMTLSESGSAQDTITERLLAYRKRVLEEAAQVCTTKWKEPDGTAATIATNLAILSVAAAIRAKAGEE
jgi:hypothetical protein